MLFRRRRRKPSLNAVPTGGRCEKLLGWSLRGLSEEMMAEHTAAFLARLGFDPARAAQSSSAAPRDGLTTNHPHFAPAAAPKAEIRTGFLLPDDPDHPKKIVTEAGVRTMAG